MKILITGATGFIGRALSGRLAAQGHSLRVLTRNPRVTQGSVPAGTDVVAWDASAPLADTALEGVDAVVHLAGENVGARWTAARKRRIMDSRVQGTRALVDAIGRARAQSQQPMTLVAASASGWYGDGGDRLLNEGEGPAVVAPGDEASGDETSGGDFLAQVCAAWERESFRAGKFGVRTVAVRTGLVLGTEGGPLPRLILPHSLGLGATLGPGSQWWSWIHVEDIAGILAHALFTPALRGPVNACAPQPVTQEQFARTLSHALRRPIFLRIPALALRLALGEMSEALLHGQRMDCGKILAAGYTFRHPALEPAIEDLIAG